MLKTLENIKTEAFLAEHWQKKPLFIKQAIPDFQNPLTPDELAGLACEEDIISRLIIENTAKKTWSVKHGPFDDDDFTTLPASNWSLLVSDIEKHIFNIEPAAYQLIKDTLNYFRFIPDWRIDDLMISYAPPGGSVGAHVDEYDVFLLQASGHRKWQIGSDNSDSNSDLDYIEGLDLKILKEFSPEQEWTLKPGDILYLPPGVPHHGVAIDDEQPCMTWSIGFRAPSKQDIITGFSDYLASKIKPERYADPDLTLQSNPGEISNQTLDRVQNMLTEHLSKSDKKTEAITDWFGCYISEPQHDISIPPAENLIKAENLIDLITQDKELICHPAARFLYIENKNDNEKTAKLFVNGELFLVATEFAKQLCSNHCIKIETIKLFSHNKLIVDTLTILYNNGYLILKPLPDEY